MSITSRRHPNFGRNDRVGRHARNNVWAGLISFVRRTWFIHPIVLLLPGAISFLMFRNDLRATNWFTLGIVVASSFWFDLLFVILWSGLAPIIMGIEGEASTAEVLRNFAGKGWTLFNGLHLKGVGDIDHVLVGPAGVLIFETKWSGQQWPMELHAKGYLADRIKKSLLQIKRSRILLQDKFKDVIGEAPVYTVCVLWSAMDSAKLDRFFYRETVYGIRGPELSGWLKELPINKVSPIQVEEIASSISDLAQTLDQEDFLAGKTYRLTLNQIAIRYLLIPFVSFLSPWLLLWGIAELGSDNWIYAGTATLVAVIAILRVKLKLKVIPYSILGGLIAMAAYTCFYFINN
jgi:hypothetical protein